ncbi:MAG: uracil-DNA glycosylase [Promethearchaeia archaeon]
MSRFPPNMKKNLCRWYDETSAMKRAYDQSLIDKKWVEEYCWNGGKDCVRKKRFEEEGYVSPDYVLPDGSESPKLKKLYESRYED